MINLTLLSPLKNGVIKKNTSECIEVFFPKENLTLTIGKNSIYYNEVLLQTSPLLDLTSLGYKYIQLEPKETISSKKDKLANLISKLSNEDKKSLLDILS